jgi:hypothetical protein
MITLTPKQKLNIPEQDILRQEETEKLKKEECFKTKFEGEIEKALKEAKQVLNNYYG